MRVKEGSERAGLKLNIKKTKIMSFGPITSWQIKCEKVEVMADFLFLGSKITTDGDCSHEIRRWLLLGRKAMTNLDSVLKSKDITLPTKVCRVKVWSFQWWRTVVRDEGGAPKNGCLQTEVLEKTPESPLDSKEIKAVNLKEDQSWMLIGRTDAEGLVFWSYDVNSDSLEKYLMLGKTEGRRRGHWQWKDKAPLWAGESWRRENRH